MSFRTSQIKLNLRLVSKSFRENGPKKAQKTVFPIFKGKQPHIVYGVVYAPDEVDAHNEFATAETIYIAAHKFMAEFQNLNLMHEVPLEGRQASIVESFIAPIDYEIGGQVVKAGSWVLAAEVYDPFLWTSIENGEITGWSLEGLAAYGGGVE